MPSPVRCKDTEYLDKMVFLFCFIDDFLLCNHHKDRRINTLADSEILFIYLVSFLDFGGNYAKTMRFLYDHTYTSHCISRSYFSKRLAENQRFLSPLFEAVGTLLRAEGLEFCLDTFPVPVCQNVRAYRCKLLKGHEFWGYNASKKIYYYGLKGHLLTTAGGCPVEVALTEASRSDLESLDILPFSLPAESVVFCDKIYNDYRREAEIKEMQQVHIKPLRKKNSKKEDTAAASQFYRKAKRKRIETTISQVVALFPKKIHATNTNGFCVKIFGFVTAFALACFF